MCKESPYNYPAQFSNAVFVQNVETENFSSYLKLFAFFDTAIVKEKIFKNRYKNLIFFRLY